ncbi:pheA operon leader peptide PheL [Cronobacter muytjensii]|nr:MULTISPECIES: pheA operon leader peptide PheL [Cronobacter]EKF2280795.1 pheA operon leader peptide PheL [Cronobacter dublinensis]EKF2290582.1 pheA operon leader peptide PheL [Cronobacter dublinensis]EKF2295515.1 pheA operon leader peptide PheL [Cronobacter dublinensis]EKK5270549.1 pheA operon leader peptide PheL [Cronobacter dublinensis]EKM0138915.1 pheA operon leader peptide PheL [Cronobacter dublinensis]
MKQHPFFFAFFFTFP